MMKIIGVHPVEASESVHLIEAELDRAEPDYNWGQVTQETPSQPHDNWQVPYDERPLDDAGKRWAFFFHYLDTTRPLLTPDGAVRLPQPSALPGHLAGIDYEEP
jgi:hypothetical protein